MAAGFSSDGREESARHDAVGASKADAASNGKNEIWLRLTGFAAGIVVIGGLTWLFTGQTAGPVKTETAPGKETSPTTQPGPEVPAPTSASPAPGQPVAPKAQQRESVAPAAPEQTAKPQPPAAERAHQAHKKPKKRAGH